MNTETTQIQISVSPSDIKLVRERVAMLCGSIEFDRARLKTITESLACSYICELKSQLRTELLEQNNDDDNDKQHECIFATNRLEAREHAPVFATANAIQP